MRDDKEMEGKKAKKKKKSFCGERQQKKKNKKKRTSVRVKRLEVTLLGVS